MSRVRTPSPAPSCDGASRAGAGAFTSTRSCGPASTPTRVRSTDRRSAPVAHTAAHGAIWRTPPAHPPGHRPTAAPRAPERLVFALGRVDRIGDCGSTSAVPFLGTARHARSSPPSRVSCSRARDRVSRSRHNGACERQLLWRPSRVLQRSLRHFWGWALGRVRRAGPSACGWLAKRSGAGVRARPADGINTRCRTAS
jgi:hypothetical protein